MPTVEPKKGWASESCVTRAHVDWEGGEMYVRLSGICIHICVSITMSPPKHSEYGPSTRGWEHMWVMTKSSQSVCSKSKSPDSNPQVSHASGLLQATHSPWSSRYPNLHVLGIDGFFGANWCRAQGQFATPLNMAS